LIATNEIDVLADHGLTLVPIEVKSGQTITPDFFTSLRKWTSLAQEEAGRPQLIYAGDQAQQRQDAEVLPWNGVAGLAEIL